MKQYVEQLFVLFTLLFSGYAIGQVNTTPINTGSTTTSTQPIISGIIQEKYKLIPALIPDTLSKKFLQNDYEVQKYIATATKMNYGIARFEILNTPASGPDSLKKIALVNFPKNYSTFFEKKLKPEINSLIDEVSLIENSNESEAATKITLLDNLMSAIILQIPTNMPAKQLKKETEKFRKAITEKYESRIYTGVFHKNNVNKILFSKTPIIAGQEDPSQFITHFDVKDNIYAIAYLNNTLEQLTSNSPEGGYIVTTDKSEKKIIEIQFQETDLMKSYYPIDIIPAPDKAIRSIDPVGFANIFASLSSQTHTISVSVVCIERDSSRILVSGTFLLDWTTSEKEKIKKNAELAGKNAADNYAKIIQLPSHFKNPSHEFEDDDLSYSKMKKVLIKNWTNCHKITDIKVFGDGTEEDWIFYKDVKGSIQSRSNHAAVGVTYIGKDGWCYFVDGITFSEDYLGKGSYGELKIMNEGVHQKIDCNNIK